MTATSVGSLVVRLLEAGERAALIARACRAEKVLFDLLVEEKTGSEKNQRFVQDFKTLADVLIQETVRHYLGNQFPALEGHIHGEESNVFTNARGKTVQVRVMDSEVATASLLEEVLDENCVAAQLLARMVHHPLSLSLPSEFDAVREDLLDLSRVGVWIDPIDSTNEYIHGTDGEAGTRGLYTRGLRCVTVLIGLFDRSTGVPLLGVVAQPFWQNVEDGAGGWMGRVACGVANAGKTAVYISLPSENGTDALTPGGSSNNKFCVLSSSESVRIKEKLVRVGWQISTPAGAGYKLLSVIDGTADAFLLSKGSSFKWDTCGPQAILKACGGNVFSLAPLLEGREPEELLYHRPECEEDGTKWSNKEGILAFRSKEAYQELIQDIVG